MSTDSTADGTQSQEQALRARAEAEDAAAQYALGVLYENGDGVPEDSRQAAEWFQMVAERGDADAQFCLGVKYEVGMGVPLDYVRAAAWFCQAIEQGYADAMFELAKLYIGGRGVTRDLVEACMWATVATALGTREDRQRYAPIRRALTEELTRSQTTAARSFAAIRINKLAGKGGSCAA